MSTENINPEFVPILHAIARRGGEATVGELKNSIYKYNGGGGAAKLRSILPDMVSLQIVSVRTVKAGNGKPVDTYVLTDPRDSGYTPPVKSGPRKRNASSSRNGNADNGNTGNRRNDACRVKFDPNDSAITISIPGKPDICIDGWQELVGFVVNAINGSNERNDASPIVNVQDYVPSHVTHATEAPIPFMYNDEPFDAPPKNTVKPPLALSPSVCNVDRPL